MCKELSLRITLTKWVNRIRYCFVALMNPTPEIVAEYTSFVVRVGKTNTSEMR